MLNILAAILLFGFVIMFHELGHFLLAKANGVEVTECVPGVAGNTVFSKNPAPGRFLRHGR